MTTSTKPRKITATAENGQVFTRKTARTYTHAVYMEVTFSDGTVVNHDPSYCGRPDLAAKALSQVADRAKEWEGGEDFKWSNEKGCFVGTGIFRTKCRAICVPVNE